MVRKNGSTQPPNIEQKSDCQAGNPFEWQITAPLFTSSSKRQKLINYEWLVAPIWASKTLLQEGFQKKLSVLMFSDFNIG